MSDLTLVLFMSMYFDRQKSFFYLGSSLKMGADTKKGQFSLQSRS